MTTSKLKEPTIKDLLRVALASTLNLASKGRYDVDFKGAQEINNVIEQAQRAIKESIEEDKDGITE